MYWLITIIFGCNIELCIEIYRYVRSQQDTVRKYTNITWENPIISTSRWWVYTWLRHIVSCGGTSCRFCMEKYRPVLAYSQVDSLEIKPIWVKHNKLVTGSTSRLMREMPLIIYSLCYHQNHSVLLLCDKIWQNSWCCQDYLAVRLCIYCIWNISYVIFFRNWPMLSKRRKSAPNPKNWWVRRISYHWGY